MPVLRLFIWLLSRLLRDMGSRLVSANDVALFASDFLSCFSSVEPYEFEHVSCFGRSICVDCRSLLRYYASHALAAYTNYLIGSGFLAVSSPNACSESTLSIHLSLQRYLIHKLFSGTHFLRLYMFGGSEAAAVSHCILRFRVQGLFHFIIFFLLFLIV